MNRLIAGVLVAGLGLTAFPSGAHAGANASAKILIHVQPRVSKNSCGAYGQPACPEVVTNGALYPNFYYAYLVVVDGDATAGVAGLQCGIDYDGTPLSGVDVFGWTLCATLQFITPEPGHYWPNDGGGTAITWNSNTMCQRYEPGGTGTGVSANAGYFYMAAYTPGRLEIIPRPIDNKAVVYDCSSIADVIAGTGAPPIYPSPLGYANFTAGGTIPGWNPCYSNAVPVQPTTWSGIKGSYRY